MTAPRTIRTSNEQGFALIVITALFMAFALVAGALIDRMNVTQQLQQQNATRAQLTRISNALIQYSLFNSPSGRYPCPADPTVAEDNPTFGASIACQTGSPANIKIFTGGEIIMGMVPVQALIPYGVDPTDAFDAWNNRIMYVVNRELTPLGIGTLTTALPGASQPVVKENNTGVTFHTPDFIVMSYGRDGLGAYSRGSTTPASIAIACPPDGSLRAKNCLGNLNFVQAPPLTAPSATALTPASGIYFDDLLSFYGQ